MFLPFRKGAHPARIPVEHHGEKLNAFSVDRVQAGQDGGHLSAMGAVKGHELQEDGLASEEVRQGPRAAIQVRQGEGWRRGQAALGPMDLS
jgi:hypothetical protein